MNLATSALLRWHARHPLLLALTVLGAALGAATVIAIDLANSSSARAFDRAVAGMNGQATHQVIAGSGGIPDTWYRDLRVRHGITTAAPIVSGQAVLSDDTRLSLLGIDPIAEASLRPHLGRSAIGGGDGESLLTMPGAIAVTREHATRRNWAINQVIEANIGAQACSLHLVALLDPADELAATALRDVMVTDIATAQELLHEGGRLDRIDLRIDDPSLLPPLPAGAVLRAADAGRTQLAEMTKAFHLNLNALSLLALAVAVFLVFNALSFAVVQRRSLIGRLRAAGAEPAQLARALLLEALLLGLAATLLGGIAGRLLAELLLDQIAATLSGLYVARDVATLSVDTGSIAKALLAGVGAALIAAAIPSWEALRVAPRAALIAPAPSRRGPLCGLVAAVVIGALAWGLLSIDRRGLASAFAATALAIAAGSCAIPALLVAWCRGGAAIARACRRPLAVMAWSGPATGLRRTAVAAAALVLAVAAALGVEIMVGSFRGTLERWLGDTLQADIYASAGTGLTSDDQPVNPAFIAAVRADPDAAYVTLRRDLELHGRERSFRAIVVDPPQGALPPLRAGEPEWDSWRSDGVILSEQLAWRLALEPGDAIELRGQGGWIMVPIVAISADFAGDQGILYWHVDSFSRRFSLPPADGLAVSCRPGADVDAVVDRLRRIEAGKGLSIRSQRALREASIAVFDQTFAVTEALRLLATGVAVIGVIGAIAALAAERRRSCALLRARGATPRQVWTLMLGECGVLGLFCGTIAIPAGLGLSAMLTLIINQRSFGWTLELDPSPHAWPAAALTAVLAALIAGVVPALRAARATPAEVLRDA